MATAPTNAGQITVEKITLAQPYIGVSPLGITSPDRANQEAKITLGGSQDLITYLCGIVVTGSGATAANVVNVTVAGLVGGTRNFIYGFEAGAAKINQPLILYFNPPLPANAPDSPVTVTCPASGTGGLHNTVTAWGYASSVGD